jgi:hypothetical protein
MLARSGITEVYAGRALPISPGLPGIDEKGSICRRFAQRRHLADEPNWARPGPNKRHPAAFTRRKR